ncbi:hypothetical protein AMTR_s00038p00197840 [Amborella trichopoda]|uniref:Uncharacterized protein n=1 Tax=Amborella trichopoda TaxID=13333 RepID=U5D2R8_AMBTC|nr:hypothetical protein AMTR_s00038p00197840 [Amborella trichopoda]
MASIEALAMAGADSLQCGIEFGSDIELPSSYHTEAKLRPLPPPPSLSPTPPISCQQQPSTDRYKATEFPIDTRLMGNEKAMKAQLRKWARTVAHHAASEIRGEREILYRELR